MLYPVLVPTTKDILSGVFLAAIANWTAYEGKHGFMTAASHREGLRLHGDYCRKFTDGLLL
ncbi:hypothetical protein GNF10_24070 [Nostoc sp. UCD121]|uniref:hypothetical protein n=1 Tax=unclassified Nostoc TaxID=2593658 RepID=UPI001629905F|nr:MULTISPECIES: hypothetical protein [unclassified Nostoc]MBC1218796.1 hypothetical protein [Nostoc sp. UCD120]MBC1278958.1 hypothetical protein [Nostoc sp. UCD121]MBC1295178.1 hypothetical protein [Nostoc sp. UCD122]